MVVGLGNPGARYARTRHNVGFRLVESMAPGEARWKDFEGLGRTVRDGALVLAEPLTYMNESGRCVRALSRFFKIAPEEILVCFDDVALPLGRLRLRESGSSGGHKGMQSLIEFLGSDRVPRLRLGVGPQPAGADSTDFVLGRFSTEEERLLPEVLESAREAVRAAVSEGLAAAMNRFNPAPKAP